MKEIITRKIFFTANGQGDWVVTAVSHDTDVEKDIRTHQDEALEPRWKVIAHDDPITTMEFVVRIMVQVFKKPLIFAEAIMWQVHNEGLSVVDTLPKAEAERRVKMATMAARLEGFPFRFTLEPAD
ncbi:MAG: ATP-dependent Clp protease adaptor ClpS [Anaerolineaceae bacterium]|nr:ATP-dependent Clp protease adaptor ClpS [Anaerolineaceae bacterium]